MYVDISVDFNKLESATPHVYFKSQPRKIILPVCLISAVIKFLSSHYILVITRTSAICM